MKNEDYAEIYDTALNLAGALELEVKEYFTTKQLALWAMTVYNAFDQVKVITTRLLGDIDCSVIVSHLRLSVIINDTNKASWLAEEDVIKYEELDIDLTNLMHSLDTAFIKADYK